MKSCKYLPEITKQSARFFSNNMARVTVKQGELEGTTETTKSGCSYYSFKGIPYAAPPIGSLRFAAPRPPLKWDGIRDASEHGSICPQYDMSIKEWIEGSEDCLFLNVYTPNLNGCLPVMFWIHGGGFLCGSGDSMLYGPDYLIEENVVLVTINYRLEAFGFLCLDTPEVPGNAGLKDQVYALRWVRDNISSFGGNPKNVTIFGQSSGAACVTYHMVSPMTRGLFHKAIAQSGCFVNDWASPYSKHSNVDRAYRLGRLLSSETNDKQVLLDALKNAPPSKFFKAGMQTATELEKSYGYPAYFLPAVESKFEGQECFLPESAMTRLKNGNFTDVPLLMGYTNLEGILFVSPLRNYKDFKRKLNKGILELISPELAQKLGDQIEEFYFGSEESPYNAVNLHSDRLIIHGVHTFANELVSKMSSPMYLYRFCADGKLNFTKHMSTLPKLKGASHVDDQFYLFKTWMELEESSEDRMAMKRVVRMWSNFAKHGNPTPDGDSIVNAKWKPMTTDEFNYLEIGFKLRPDVNPDEERMNFWKSLYQKVQKVKSNL